MAGIDQLRKGLRSAIRGMWNGALTIDQATHAFNAAIERRLLQAWVEGAAECNIAPDEFSQAEITARDEFIETQMQQAPNFIRDVAAKPRGEGKLGTQYQRIEMWANQYSSAFQMAEAMACSDEKRQWVIGRTEHCATCLRLNGQVRRMSFWLSHVMPRNAPNDKLECKGYRCQCLLKKTNKPISHGRLPGIAF